MVILKEKPIAMPRPFGGVVPVITVGPRTDGKNGNYATVQISGVITSPYQFLEVFELLDAAGENDVIDIVIDTPGGCVFTTQLLLERMNSSKATVTAVASGLVASAGTFLWSFSKHKRVEEWATFMFHSSSHGDVGKSLTILQTSKEMVQFMKATVVKGMIEAGLLNSEEAGKIFKQKKDLFLPASILRARLLTELAATEGLRLVNEDGEYKDPEPGKGSENDHPTDPEGNPDEHAGDDVDGQTTEINVADIFRAEGVEPAEGDSEEEGQGEETGDGDGEGEGETGSENENPEAKCGKKGKKAKKAGKKRPKGEGEGGGDGEGEPGSEENPVDPEEATAPTAYLKW